MMLILFAVLGFGDYIKLTAQPYDFQVENDPATYVKGSRIIDQIEDQVIFVPTNEPSVLLINPPSKEVVRFGKKGDGPGELGYGSVRAISPGTKSLWVLDNKNRASLFVDAQFQTTFRIKSYLIGGDTPYTKPVFAHNDLFVVIPAYPAGMTLANVYDYSGEVVQKLGKILPIDPEMLQWNRAINDTAWRYLNGKWYCLFFYRPYIRIYNGQFELEKELLVAGPEVDFFEEIFQKMEPDPNFPQPRPHFTDFQVTKEHIYVMCKGVLYQMDHTGKVVSRTGFYGNEKARKILGYSPLVGFPHAVVMKSGRVFLGVTGNYLDHDLWYADAPHLKRKID